MLFLIFAAGFISFTAIGQTTTTTSGDGKGSMSITKNSNGSVSGKICMPSSDGGSVCSNRTTQPAPAQAAKPATPAPQPSPAPAPAAKPATPATPAPKCDSQCKDNTARETKAGSALKNK